MISYNDAMICASSFISSTAEKECYSMPMEIVQMLFIAADIIRACLIPHSYQMYIVKCTFYELRKYQRQ